jgi:glycosyltransferase involved in cell wall biosynthesis
VFVNVSASEGLPVAIMEAMSCGIPVIAPAVGGIPEIVNSENGVLLPGDCHPRHVADAIWRVVRTDSAARRRRARETWREHCAAQSNYTHFVGRLQHVIAAHARNEARTCGVVEGLHAASSARREEE